jgi:glycosyltransferase involved in cell wall biosynthesis
VSTPQAPLVSVVTPVYNGARYLRECIESVLAQGYGNWRYLLLNNRSTDASLEIAQHYARLDSRIRVHDSAEFLPIIDNHNRALSLLDADSDYCKPLMADDRLYPSCIESLVQAALARPRTGLVCCLGMTARGDVLFDYLPTDGRAVSHLSGGAACRLSFLEDRHFFGSPSTMLVRTDLIRKRVPFYDPRNLHADAQSCYDILRESDFAFVHEPLVFIRVHEASHASALRDLETIMAGRMYTLSKYGRAYLNEGEFALRFAARREQYYARLAAAALTLPGRKFWEFHERMLALSDAPLERGRLLRAVAAYGARRLRSPGSLLRGIAHRLGGSRAPGG